MRSLILSASLALGVVALAGAAQAAERCGPSWWRGLGGFCHPMAVGLACPLGWHLGPEGQRCFPN
jgi:hypothetical protein